MRERAITPAHVALVVLGLALVCACDGHHYDDDDDHYNNYVVYYETEPNDFVDEADDFGTLYPGDAFGIAGEVYDDGIYLDDLDGFAFRSSDPLIVAFDLFVDDVWSEVRVGLYDPGIDETVAYWYQNHGHVYGELDVYYAHTDFHLFVELLHGDTTYELELEAFYAYGAAAEARSPALLTPRDAELRLSPREASSLSADEQRDAARYGRRPTAAAASEETVDPVIGTMRLFVLDEETGELSRDSFLFTAGGSWMGMPGSALVE